MAQRDETKFNLQVGDLMIWDSDEKPLVGLIIKIRKATIDQDVRVHIKWSHGTIGIHVSEHWGSMWKVQRGKHRDANH